ncbi:hypothetical protein FBU59_001129 [Linderina macrospora]|uniref:Uncharacterized protein n=1 Tax=Linderina macrospora TaxID=4868 RepID=A0ACC1JEX9_9FUNG|nr:hypothetical protein FBU59_001129 [Linderina macrospora]
MNRLLARSFSTTLARLQEYPYALRKIAHPPIAPSSAPHMPETMAALTFGAPENATRSSIVGWLKDSSAKIEPANFIENPDFTARIQAVLEKHAHEDPALQAQAAFQKSGWMNVADGRNPPPLGRTPAAEDILGAVLVEDKIIQPGSFQPNFVHRPVSLDGLFQLPAFLHDKLVDSL